MDNPLQNDLSSASGPHEYVFVRARQLEGTFPGDTKTGVWPVTCNRIMRGWGQVGVWDAYAEWPPPDPSTYDKLAKDKRIDSYSRVWDFADCQLAIHHKVASTVSFYVTELWKNPPEGRLDFNQDGLPIKGGHSLGIVPQLHFMPCPMDWEESEFLLSHNSWGSEWGNRGWAAISKEFFNKYLYTAWALETEVKMPTIYGSGIQDVFWTRFRFDDRIALAYDIIDADSDDRLAWALFTWRRGEVHVDDLYVKPEHRGKGYGTRMMKHILDQHDQLNHPVRFWIPFADVDTISKAEGVLKWFSRFGLRIEKSPRPWAAYTATVGEPIAELPAINIPPKPGFVFAETTEEVISDEQLEKLRKEYGVSEEFKQIAGQTIRKHAEVLKRLA